MGRSRGVAALRRQPVPRHPRRVSGPARPVPVPGSPRPRTIAPQPHETLGAKLLALPDHRWLDMLLRSRAWIWLLGVALGGIVFMQVSLLGMNSGIGRAVEQSSTLEHRNAALEEEVAELSSGDRVRAQATKLGLLSPDAGEVGFLTARGDLDARRALQRMTPPSDEARQTLATDGRPATIVAAVPTAVPTAVATPVATTAPTAATPVPTAAAPPVPTAAAPAPTAAPPTTTVSGATAAP
jgi:cell division protein FtsB